jgi:thioredoxin-like negative regulator of GroEL
MKPAHTRSIVTALFAAAALSAFASGQTPPLQMCLTTAADFSPIHPSTTFPDNLREISCAFALGDSESFGTLTSIWTAIDVGDVAPPNYEIARTDTPLKNMKRGRFRYSQDGPMPAGRYKLDVLADGKPWQSLEFTVVPAAEPMALRKPADLFPLEKGKRWSYDFVQESGKGAKVSLPGIEPDAQGRCHATVIMTVDKTEAHGTHIQIRRNDELVAEEWWKVGAKGLSATQRKIGGELIKLDPPQILWALPLKSPAQWSYSPKDGSFTQNYSMWGPLPVRGPNGDQPGYVVAIEQPSSIGKVSVERDFIPGFGLTREVIISAINGEMMSRQEMSITGASTVAISKVSSSTSSAASPTAPIRFESDFSKALERANSEGKPLMLEFYSPKCAFCTKMAKEVHPDPKVAALANGLVWARINQDESAGAQLSRQFNGGATPTYMAVAQDGKTVYYRFSDAVSVDGFVENLSAIAVSPDQYLPVIEKFKNGEQPNDQAKLILARGTLREANMDLARMVLTKLADDDPTNKSEIVDDVLILSGHVDNALWTDDGAASAKNSWMRIVKEFPKSDRAPDAVFYLSELFREAGPKDKGKALEKLLTTYPANVDIGAAAKILEGN